MDYPGVSAFQGDSQQEIGTFCMIYYLYRPGNGALYGMGWANMDVSSSSSNLNREVMSNEANINVSVPRSLVKSEFIAMQFIFLLPSLWMLSADVSDKPFLCPNKSNLSSSPE